MNKRLNKFGIELGELLEFQNISINEYAERIGTTPKNLIDIIEGKVSLSFNIICNIAFVSDIPVDYISNVEESYKIDCKIKEYLEEKNISIRNYINEFNYKELKDKYGLVFKNDLNDYSIARSILKYLRISDPKTLLKENNHIFYKSKNDKPELLALWLEHCYRVIQDQKIGEYNKANIEAVVFFIKREAERGGFDKEELIKVFNKNGIYLAIEPDLKGSKIRGAFRVLNNKPAIYITTKYKRIADVYFALLHELAHCKSDFNRAKNGSIVSLMDDDEKKVFENKADKCALNWMVNDSDYEEIIKSKKYEYENMPFLVYRLAQDGIIKYNSNLYQENNKQINNLLLNNK